MCSRSPGPVSRVRRPAMYRLCAALLAAALTAAVANQPAITRPILFTTPEADRVLAALQVFPPDNPWNEDISRLPLHPGSAAMIADIGADKRLAYNLDMSFI